MQCHYVIVADYDARFQDAYVKAIAGDALRGGVIAIEEVIRKLPPATAHILKEHISYLENLCEKGILSAAGPCTDFRHAIFVYKVTSREEVARYFEADPYVKEKVFTRWEIFEWVPALGRSLIK